MTSTAHEDQFTPATQTILRVNVIESQQQIHNLQTRLAAAIERAEAAEAELAELREREAKQKPVAMVDAGDDGYFAEILPDCSVSAGDMLYAFPPLNSDPTLWKPSFDQWWDAHGQYLRAGGGQYEKTFGYHAWEAAAALYAAPVPAPHKGATHCDDCGLTWLDDGLNPLVCPYCKNDVPTPAITAEWRDAVGAALGLLENTTCESGVCMCGDSVIGHADFSVGHSACDSGTYHQSGVTKQLRALLQSAEATK